MTKEQFLELVNTAEAEYRKNIEKLTAMENGAMLPGFEHINFKTLKERAADVDDKIKRVVAYLAGLPETALFKGNTRQPMTNMIVVPLNTNGGHNYTVGQPVMVTDSANMNGMLKRNMSKGNNMKSTEGDWRIATDEEKDAFATEVAPKINLTFKLG